MAIVSLERKKIHTKVPTKGRGSWLLFFLTLLPLRRRLVSESQDPTLRRGRVMTIGLGHSVLGAAAKPSRGRYLLRVMSNHFIPLFHYYRRKL